MNAEEIIKELRLLSENDEWAFAADITDEAADLIESLQAQLAAIQKEVASLAIESIEREKTLARLEAEVMVWAKAEQEGRLVVLPCKPNERWIGEQGEIVVIKIVTDWTGTYVHYRYKGKREVCCCNPTYFAIHFTREEAEAALRKEQSDETHN